MQIKIKNDMVAEGIYRISVVKDGVTGSALNRYGFIQKIRSAGKDRKARLAMQQNSFTLKDKKGEGLLLGTIVAGEKETLFSLRLEKGERFYGLGDQTRDRIEQSGSRAVMKIENVNSYIPIPFIMSSRGYGILVNTTLRHNWDIGSAKKGLLTVTIPEGTPEFYIFKGNSFKELLNLYTQITGRPDLPPRWSFGLWFICRMQANDFEVMSDARNFRDRGLPCDVIGLEPGWMEKNYDYSIEKRWDPQRFPIPSYAPNGPHTFISALKRMGYKMELWLCNDYDLSYEEERRLNRTIKKEAARSILSQNDVEKDKHFTEPVRLDNITRPEQPWFEHLKKFIDQGVDFFKQDGALQVCEHPDRLYGNGMTDEEMHNLYSLLYSRQMYEGFKEYTGRRPCCFTPSGWAGLQRYTGTWTGDTGGGPKTLVACLNLSLSGHSLVTCDMEVTTKEGIHYGFLMPWAQINSWNYFRHPWLQGDDILSVIRDYAHLRSRLVPYLYTYAYQAHTTGTPMMRPLVLEFPEDPKCVNNLNEYLLGGELLVTAFTEDIYLPKGQWLDYWTGRIYEGGKEFRYSPPERRGGGLFLRENSILPVGPLRQYTEQPSSEGFSLKIFINPGGTAEFRLYDDDGISFAYETGEYRIYTFKAVYERDALALTLPQNLKVDSITVYSSDRPDRFTVNGKTSVLNWFGNRGLYTLNSGDEPKS
jgi:alpha-glucosidase